MKTIKFVKPKGEAQEGYIGSYPDNVANRMIDEGFAEEYKPSRSRGSRTASQTQTETSSDKKGLFSKKQGEE